MNLCQLPDFTSHTCRRGTLYTYMNCVIATSNQLRVFPGIKFPIYDRTPAYLDTWYKIHKSKKSGKHISHIRSVLILYFKQNVHNLEARSLSKVHAKVGTSVTLSVHAYPLYVHHRSARSLPITLSRKYLHVCEWMCL